MFHVRRRPADYHPRKRKKKPQQKWNKGSELMEYRYEDGYDRLPFFLELNPGALHCGTLFIVRGLKRGTESLLYALNLLVHLRHFG